MICWNNERNKSDRGFLALAGDFNYREPVTFIRREDGSLNIWIDGGETGDTEGGFYDIEAERTFTAEEVEMLKQFLAS